MSGIGVIATIFPFGSFPVVDPKDISSVGAPQSVWYVDPVAGLDTNTGVSAGTALQTCNELRRRLRMMTLPLYEIFVLNDIPSTDYIGLDPMDQSPGVGSVLAQVFWYGTRTITSASSFTANGTAAVPASNLAPALTDASVADWNTNFGKLLVVSSGASLGATTWIHGAGVPVQPAGSSNVSPWHISTYTTVLVPGNTPATPPLSGATYNLVSLTLVRRAIFSGRVKQTFINFDFTGMAALTDSSFILGADVTFSTCKVTHYMRPVFNTITLYDCFIDGGSPVTNPAQTGFEISGSRLFMYFCCGRNTHLNAFVTARYQSYMSSLYGLYQGRCLILDKSFVQFISENGIFHSAYQAVGAEASLVHFFGNTYGVLHTQAVLAVKQTQIVRRIGANIYLTGTVYDLSINVRTSFVAPLQPLALVPTVGTMTTWAELAAPPFNGNCVDVEGTSVTTAVV